MGYTIAALKDKILEMYPEIEKNSIQIGLVFSKEKNTYFVNFRKGLSVFATHLEKDETDACMGGVKFQYLGSQIGCWMNNVEANQTQASIMLAARSVRDQAPVSAQYISSCNGKE
ncbi:MAG: hypothetical protein HZB62_00520 [Nitrospirae bacterium]|nr:hypothetical protein [Nitrospirota bacterium]